MDHNKTTIDGLATMVKSGFDGVHAKMQKGFDDVHKQFQQVNKRIDILHIGQEDIKLRLDHVAYKFELHALEKRVDVLEDKVGIK